MLDNRLLFDDDDNLPDLRKLHAREKPSRRAEKPAPAPKRRRVRKYKPRLVRTKAEPRSQWEPYWIWILAALALFVLGS